jgi:cyclopropane fatty-acyl-phospholipid synthase-like methyltransferase
VAFFQRIFLEQRGREPLILREDFCAAAAVCVAWVQSGKNREAWGIDLDPEPLAWGKANNLTRLKEKQLPRVHLIEGDVRSAKSPPADLIAAQNFSYFCFFTRAELLEYFKAAHANLADDGVFVCDVMGGALLWDHDTKETRKIPGARYIWEQTDFDPISHRCHFYIHFKFKDGSTLKNAFEYDWRMWTVPEIRELLEEAGFSQSVVYWDLEEGDEDADGEYNMAEKAPPDPAFISYIVGLR